MQAVILAGGLGTRLRPVVSDLPKAMAPVGGRPFLEYLLDNLREQGIRDIILAVGHLRDTIISHFGNSWRGLNIGYSIETVPLGTGGALKKAALGMPDVPTVVMNGDTWLELDLEAMLAAHQRFGADITVAVRHVPDIARYGAVAIAENCITGFSEKGMTGPGFINAGVYLLMPSLFGRLSLSDEFSFEHDILVRYVRDLRIGAFPTTGRFIDIGVPGDYKLAEHILGQTGNAR